MIAKRVERKMGSRYSALVGYLLRETGQPVLERSHAVSYTRISNCNLEEVDLAVKEIEAIQALNTRSKIDRTYHLVVSFPTGEKPAPEQLDDIENKLCEAIGLGDHQRMSVAHKDTENLHVHLAINKIHPETHRAIEPYYDNYKLDTACAELERKHGLQRDNRIDREHQRDRIETGRQSGRAGDLEAHFGQASFKRWLAERKEAVTKELARANSWPDAHWVLANHGLSLRPRGAGLVIANQAGNVFVKASDLGRDFSKAKLEQRLGEYRAQDETTQQVPEKAGYPTLKNDPLWAAYQQEMEPLHARRAQLLADSKKTRDEEIRRQKLAYEKSKLSIFFDTTLSRGRKAEIAKNLAVTRMKISRESHRRSQEERTRILNETTRKSWLDFLREQAKAGNRNAVKKLQRIAAKPNRKQRGETSRRKAEHDLDQGR